MPSREEMIFVTATAAPPPSSGRATTTSSTTVIDHHRESIAQDFLSRDIENLVSEIKQNLRLSGFKTRYQRRLARTSPYSNPSRSLPDCCEVCAAAAVAAAKNGDLFLKNTMTTVAACMHRRTTKASIGNLTIKSTSTTQLQVQDDPYEMLQDLLREGDLIKEAVRRLQRLSPKQRYYYESDEESAAAAAAAAARVYKKNVDDLFGSRNVEV